MASEPAVSARTVRAATFAFAIALLIVTPLLVTLVGERPIWQDPSTIAALLVTPFILLAWRWSHERTALAGQVLIAGMALAAWVFTYLIQGSGYLVGNYAYLAVIVVAAAFLVPVITTLAYAIANILVIAAVWSTTGLALSDLVLSLAYQVFFGGLLIGLAWHLELVHQQAVGLAADLQGAKDATDRILSSTWDVIVVTDNGEIVEANDPAIAWAARYFGISLRKGQPAGELLAILGDLSATRANAGLRGEAATEVAVPCGEGSRHVRIRIVARGLGGREAWFVHDVTDERLKQEAEQARIVKEAEVASLKSQQDWQRRFMNMASHELRTPLTPIRLQLEMIEPSPGVAVINRNVQRLERLVDDILDMVRLEQDRLPLHCASVDLSLLVRQQVESWRSLAHEKGLQMDVALDDHVWVEGDATRLAQVVDNLLSNAIKFTDEGRIEVSLRLDEAAAVVAVRDTGHGFRPEDAERLFEPFVRLEHVSQIHGTGLGMSICRSFAEAHGGRLTALSDGPGHGSRFELALPLVLETA